MKKKLMDWIALSLARLWLALDRVAEWLDPWEPGTIHGNPARRHIHTGAVQWLPGGRNRLTGFRQVPETFWNAFKPEARL